MNRGHTIIIYAHTETHFERVFREPICCALRHVAHYERAVFVNIIKCCARAFGRVRRACNQHSANITSELEGSARAMSASMSA